MLKVNDQNFAELVESSGLPVVLDFGATWCGPCKKLEPIIEELSKEVGDRALFAKVDIDESVDTARRYGVMSVPTVVFLKNGQPVHKFVGLMPKNKIQALLGEHLNLT